MTGIMACVATLLLGVEAGWKPLEGGGGELLIQIEPGTLQSLDRGESIESYVPAGVRDIRNCRVVIGVGELPPEYQPLHLAKDSHIASGPALSAAERPPFRASPWGSAGSTVNPSLLKTGKTSVPPGPLADDPASKPLERQARYEEPAAPPPATEAKASSDESKSPAQPAKPWPAFWAVVLALSASLAGNVYLGWIYNEARNRCRALLRGAEQEDGAVNMLD